MKTSRLEAFSDGVLAIVITIMVLELKVPDSTGTWALRRLAPLFAAYVMSFIYVGIYWSNHHHLLQLTSTVTGWSLWANLHLLFWLSLIPFVTGWMSNTGYAPLPTALYGTVLICSAIAWLLLQTVLIHGNDVNTPLREAIGFDWKLKISIALYAIAIGLTYLSVWLAIGMYVLVAGWWMIPDRRFETKLREIEQQA